MLLVCIGPMLSGGPFGVRHSPAALAALERSKMLRRLRMESDGVPAQSKSVDGSTGLRVRPQSRPLQIVVQVELKRVRAEVQRLQFSLPLIVEPGANNVRGEHVAAEQELMVVLECVECLAE